MECPGTKYRGWVGSRRDIMDEARKIKGFHYLGWNDSFRMWKIKGLHVLLCFLLISSHQEAFILIHFKIPLHGSSVWDCPYICSFDVWCHTQMLMWFLTISGIRGGQLSVRLVRISPKLLPSEIHLSLDMLKGSTLPSILGALELPPRVAWGSCLGLLASHILQPQKWCLGLQSKRPNKWNKTISDIQMHYRTKTI